MTLTRQNVWDKLVEKHREKGYKNKPFTADDVKEIWSFYIHLGTITVEELDLRKFRNIVFKLREKHSKSVERKSHSDWWKRSILSQDAPRRPRPAPPDYWLDILISTKNEIVEIGSELSLHRDLSWCDAQVSKVTKLISSLEETIRSFSGYDVLKEQHSIYIPQNLEQNMKYEDYEEDDSDNFVASEHNAAIDEDLKHISPLLSENEINESIKTEEFNALEKVELSNDEHRQNDENLYGLDHFENNDEHIIEDGIEELTENVDDDILDNFDDDNGLRNENVPTENVRKEAKLNDSPINSFVECCKLPNV